MAAGHGLSSAEQDAVHTIHLGAVSDKHRAAMGYRWWVGRNLRCIMWGVAYNIDNFDGMLYDDTVNKLRYL